MDVRGHRKMGKLKGRDILHKGNRRREKCKTKENGNLMHALTPKR